MAKKIVWDWEQIDKNTKRVKVLGGWLVHHSASKGSECMWFAPDQDWQWQPIEPYVDPKVVQANLAKDFQV